MLKCDKHKIDLACMGGRSAHRDNWYCPECDEEAERSKRTATEQWRGDPLDEAQQCGPSGRWNEQAH